ncbi:inositol 2-dehydrogenase [Aestuariispira ectoiniformans]|uniref:inositol 2-dehydrogenase n=1 Tax=Aestuariispira ectoiniformans TaxID=2775080 RepID=UPI00223C2669|nr:inositol 2-dehydrogenase [Aestuariispira ectoiniformans]
MITFCQFGAGRIGAIHAANIAAHPQASLKYVVDPVAEAAQNLADRHGAQVATMETALADPEVNAVLIASSTDTHADFIEAAARAGKAILCEKPIDLDLERTKACLQVVEETGTLLALGFNRRHDPNFRQIRDAMLDGKIGKTEMVQITSRDPSPPPAEYVARSGGLFRDMMIHDLDMAQWLLGEKPVEVFATASCLVDPAIGEAGDVDTALVTLKTASGKLAQISNSRRAAYGYDQRVEAFGEKGMLRAENVRPTTVELMTDDGATTDKPLYFFLERYEAAYRAELDDFVTALTDKRTPLAIGRDGLIALELAEAALESCKTGKAVRL